MRYVLTGAPGTGKTAVVAALSGVVATVLEPARLVIAEHAAATGEPTLDGRPELFVERLIDRSLSDFDAVPDGRATLFDRGAPDCAAYAAAFGLDPEPVLERVAAARYDTPVFVAPPWEAIYTTDELRHATFDQVVAFDAHVRWAYERLEYETIDLPRASPEDRATFIVARIDAGRS